MPIPPRPIPNSQRVRPGTSVPRKSLVALDRVDWRSEISILTDYPRSLPTGSISGVRLEKALPKPSSVEAASSASRNVKREVDMESLIADSLGKREKRSTTATTLGFDFVPNVSIVALPDDPAPSSSRSTPSLLTQTKSIPGAFPSKGRASPALSVTPATPALIPHRPQAEEEEDDLDEWEHVDALREPSEEEEREGADSQSEEDVIVLGELELEDEFDQVDQRREKKHAAKSGFGLGKARHGLTYAAALGTTQ
ncbi:hypothetical protein BD324DRAFT_647594 [Kockovaella imperatae]|uniref:Uncharacterized protein n=1 Tax=Kockovaella imperatae TaxID=4999 RepID=A0A1Y1UU12_9TREE|nr:hypothetical protein BD324DRAFT_647594 [Kockovaella imperatae]ORX40675.1 hypothetical protein BD324DRAFT_647594 [Kockovaella imperatae]